MKTEIWICGRLLCEAEANSEVVRDFERIVRRAGYIVEEKEENGKMIKIV